MSPGAEVSGRDVDPRRFRDVLGHFATGVTVVTAVDGGVPVGFTCQSFTALSLEPPLVALAPDKRSTSWPRIARAGSFCVNVLAQGQAKIGQAFAVSGGDKFSGVEWRPATNGAPIIAGSLAWVACELVLVHDAGDHELVLGRVLDLEVGSGEPLLFYRGAFRSLAGADEEPGGWGTGAG